MTNKEKFIEVFGFEPDDSVCPIYCSSDYKGNCKYFRSKLTFSSCTSGDWWGIKYEEPNKGE